MTKLLITIISILILSSCCSTDNKEFDFDHNEPRHLSSYKKGDTLFFENSEKDTDIITILSVDSVKGKKCFELISLRPMGKSCWVTIKFLPIDKWHGVTINGNTKDTISVDYKNLIEITKDPIENKTFFQFYFKNFHTASQTVLGRLNTDTLILNEKKITNYYIINHGYPDRIKDSTDIETLIWTDKCGLTAYKNKAGHWWTKK